MFVYPETDARPGEPVRVRAATGPFALRLLKELVVVALIGLLTAGLWPLFLLAVLVWGWPPHQPRLSEALRYLGYTLNARPPAPGLPPLSRAWLALRVLKKWLLVPVHGLAWALDELLYGRALARTPVVAPLLTLSAARSGSTQSARYLEEDPRLVAPMSLQVLFPYLWVWRLAPHTLGRRLSQADVRALLRQQTTEEFHQRHEGDPFRTDTFEVLFFLNRLSSLSPLFGPEVMAQDFSFMGSAPHNRHLWDHDIVDFMDRLGRKTLLWAGPQADGQPRRLFIKGHFLESRDALAARYPEAHFLTVIRDPIGRLKSKLNHLHGNPFDETLGAVPWAWLATFVPKAEVAYCEEEQAWFTRPDGPSRTVIRFPDYVRDLEGTMRKIYREAMGDEALPPHVPREHTPRERKNYLVDRSLEDVGVDTEALAKRLSAYRAWVTGG